MTFDPYPEYLTIEQAAKYLGVTPATIRRLLRQHGLGDFVRASMGKQVLIRKDDLNEMELSRGAAQPAEGARTRGRGRNSGAA